MKEQQGISVSPPERSVKRRSPVSMDPSIPWNRSFLYAEM